MDTPFSSIFSFLLFLNELTNICPILKIGLSQFQVLLTMATDEGDEAFDPSYMGTAEEVINERVGDNDFVFIKGCAASKARHNAQALDKRINVVTRTMASNPGVCTGLLFLVRLSSLCFCVRIPSSLHHAAGVQHPYQRCQ